MTTGAFVAAALAVWGIAVAGGPTGETAPLYTNQDLSRLFGPAPVAVEAATPEFDATAWEFVTNFLDRQYQLIDAEREERLRRTLVEARTEALREAERHRFGRAYPFVHYPVVGISRIGGRQHAAPPLTPLTDGERLEGPIVPLHARPGGTIVPLHARGSLVPPVR